MADYNILYLELCKRLSVLKAKLPYANSLSDAERAMYEKEIDSTFKKLDDRYSDAKYIDDIEDAVIELESKF